MTESAFDDFFDTEVCRADHGIAKDGNRVFDVQAHRDNRLSGASTQGIPVLKAQHSISVQEHPAPDPSRP